MNSPPLISADILHARILIVDDQAANVDLLEQMLAGAGYTAVSATRDPHTVCALHRDHRYDLILLDLQMPGLDGFQVMEGLKQIETGGYLPVLAITAQPGHKNRALKAGAKDFVSKPFDLGEVLLRVHNLLEVRLLHLDETRQNLERLENSQRIAGLGDWEYDFVRDHRVWSDGVYRILGLVRGNRQPDAAAFFDLIHPEDLAVFQQEKKSAAEGARRADFDYRIIRPGGEVRYVHQISELVLGADGQPLREAGTMQDITERKLADATLRESEERHRKLLLLSPDANFVHVDGVITLVNHAFCELMGAGAATELLGLPALGVAHPDCRELVETRMRLHLVNQPVPTAEMKFVRLDGTSVDVEVNAVAFDLRGRKEVQVIARNITARRRAVAALSESEERFQLVARAVSDVVWDWNLVSDEVWWSAGFQTTFGFTAEEIEPGIDSWTTRIHADERTRIVAGIHAAIDSGAESWSDEYRFKRKDGAYAFVQDRGYILRDATGTGVRMVGGMRDLTEQKKMEAQFLRAQRMESLGTLAGGIAHDLNNVLAPIMMSIELLKRDPGLNSRSVKILDLIQASSQRGADLVRQVLSFGRGLDGQRIALRLRHLVNDLEGIIVETFPRNIRISTEVPDALWPVTGDPTQLHQVLLNLAVNARDAMPSGGTLTVTATNLTLDAQYAGTSQEACAGTYVRLDVADSGQGIPPEVRERIFEPFFTTKEIGKGTGLGLATVHTVVKGHGGFLRVESEVGRGTTFSVYLPADPALRGPPTEHPFAIEPPRGCGELVLVVDDELSIRDITRQTLEAYGYRVTTAGDGTEAVALYARQTPPFALVLTDMMMPVLDGAATIQILRRINPAVRIIATSGLEAGGKSDKSLSADAPDFLPKPYTAETLLNRIRDVLDRPAPALSA